MKKTIFSIKVIVAAFAIGWAGTALAFDFFHHDRDDGVILISQERVLDGTVVAGDAAGFPLTITRPGSYRLVTNLTVPDADTTAIVVEANNVTIDLDGFSILGPTTCLPTPGPVTGCTPVGEGDGVRSTAANTYVLNGTIQGMGHAGIWCQNVTRETNVRVEKVRVLSNGEYGIGLTNTGNNIIVESVALRNGSIGIAAGFGAIVNDNVANGNGIVGIVVTNLAEIVTGVGTVIGNVADGNGSLGLDLGGAVGYAHNVLIGNNGGQGNQVSGGISLGPNICGTALCP